ncbi:MAG: TlpA family protein disulfide reductase, partial [Chitinophagaceae bacterium]|nr:TlpA family protein disulfide reductase [Chitinophagaceae bacterium]
PWYRANKNRGVEIIAIHYERRTDPAYVWPALKRFRNKFDISYTQVLGGRADKQEVAASLPALNTFLSFPTLIFIEKK